MSQQDTPVEGTDEEADLKPESPGKDPVRKWTFIILAAVILLLAWYLISDRVAPNTSQARVHALVVPIAAEVSGTVFSVDVGNNQRVEAGQALFHIDSERYRLAVEASEADLQSALTERNSALLQSTQMRRDIKVLENRLVDLEETENDTVDRLTEQTDEQISNIKLA